MTEPSDNVVRLVVEGREEIAPRFEDDADDRHGGDGGGWSGEGLPPAFPVQPLGKSGKTYWYLNAMRELEPLTAQEHGRLHLLGLMCGNEALLYRFWPRLGKESRGGERAIVGWRPELVAETLMGACARAGIWDVVNRVRGTGGWLGELGELVLHCGDAIYRSAPPATSLPPIAGDPVPRQPGQLGRFVYPAAAPAPRPAEQRVEGGEDGPGAKLLRVFGTWNWRRECDAHLLLGWTVAGMLGAALKWRPMVWTTGDAGTGKSTLHDWLKEILGAPQGLLDVVDTSAAGLWQSVKQSSQPVAVDELEADADDRKQQAVIKLARLAASGGVILRGGSDHGATEFSARNCFLFTSILIPPLRSADRQRMAILELDPLGRGTTPPSLVPADVQKMGRELRRRLLDQWPRYGRTLELFRQALAKGGHSGRQADQWGTLLACADLALNDWSEPDGDELANWAERLALGGLHEVSDDAPDHERCLEHLRSVPIDAFRGGLRQTLGTVIAEAAGLRETPEDATDTAGAQKTLGAFGVKVVTWDDGKAYVAVANNHQGLAVLFAGTHWAGRSGAIGVWVQALRRVPGHILPASPLRFAGVSARATLVPIDRMLGSRAEHGEAQA